MQLLTSVTDRVAPSAGRVHRVAGLFAGIGGLERHRSPVHRSAGRTSFAHGPRSFLDVLNRTLVSSLSAPLSTPASMLLLWKNKSRVPAPAPLTRINP